MRAGSGLSRALFVGLVWSIGALAALSSLRWASAEAADASPARPKDGIVSLYDAIGTQEKPLVMDWGFAALVTCQGRKILFDAGWDPDNLAHNVRSLGVDLSDVSAVVISHRHTDHTAGFPYVAGLGLAAPVYLPDDPTFWAWPLKAKPGMMEGLPDAPPEFLPLRGHDHEHTPRAALSFRSSDAQRVSENRQILPGVWIIRTVAPRVGDFDGYPPHSPERPMLAPMPELSLAVETKTGLVVVTGCSHSGVDTIVTAAKRQTGKEAELVFGGFHMQPLEPAQIRETIAALEALGVRRVAPVHCTGPVAMKMFRDSFGERFVYMGLGSALALE